MLSIATLQSNTTCVGHALSMAFRWAPQLAGQPTAGTIVCTTTQHISQGIGNQESQASFAAYRHTDVSIRELSQDIITSFLNGATQLPKHTLHLRDITPVKHESAYDSCRKLQAVN